MAMSERERIRINIERIDHRLEEAQDYQEAVQAVARHQFQEQLCMASRTVVSQEALNYQVRNVKTGLDVFGIQMADLSRGIEALGCTFAWGFDELVAQLELVREELREILKTLQRPLETQAKELRKRGFQALRNGWYEEALRDLRESVERDYRDFTAHRAIATIHVRKDQWRDARVSYEKASKYAWPYSQEVAAECELGASLACRQLSDFDAAYAHSQSAVSIQSESLIARYEHALNAAALSQRKLSASEELKREAVSHLRFVLWKDELYSVRVDTESYLEPIKDQCCFCWKHYEEICSRLPTHAGSLLRTLRTGLSNYGRLSNWAPWCRTGKRAVCDWRHSTTEAVFATYWNCVDTHQRRSRD